MAMFENFPYTNFHQLNLDWIIEEIKKEKDFFDNELIPLIDQKVHEAAVNLVITYEPETETLVFHVN